MNELSKALLRGGLDRTALPSNLELEIEVEVRQLIRNPKSSEHNSRGDKKTEKTKSKTKSKNKEKTEFCRRGCVFSHSHACFPPCATRPILRMYVSG